MIPAGRHLAQRWRELFARERAAYLASTAAIGVDQELVPTRRRTGRDPSIAPTRLTDLQKIYVVRRLAAYDKSRGDRGEPRPGLRRDGHHQGDRELQSCMATGRHLGKRWRELFAQARDCLASMAEIGVTQKAVRIRRRDRLALKAEEAGQFKAASDILDAIARDVGDILDKRQTQDRFAERGAPAPATINLYGRPQPDPAPKPVGRIRKPGD